MRTAGWRLAVSTSLLPLVVASSACFGELPNPLFWASEAEFRKVVDDGQFDPHLELHLLQYASDPRWAADWAANRYSGNGLFGEYGSTTARALFVNSQIALNLFPLERLQIRYERRDYQDGRFDLTDQRLDVLWYPGPGWAVLISGWPTHLKDQASAGLGLRIGAPKSRHGLVLRVVNDRFIWNEKTEESVRFASAPVRLQADGFLESGRWRVHGSVDYGLRYEAVDGAGLSTEGSQRFADVGAAYRSGDWEAGARVTAASRRRRQADEAGSVHELDRSWGRVALFLRKRLGAWTAHGLVGGAWQRDDFSSPANPDGSYAMDSVLFGVEGGRRVWKGLELRLGYLGSTRKASRSAAGPILDPDRNESDYVDKAHLRALYEFEPDRVSIELLLSQTVGGSRFGGGSVKARLIF